MALLSVAMHLPELSRWDTLAARALGGLALTREQARTVLDAPPDELLPLLHAAFRVRHAFHGRRVQLHVLENAKLGGCPEDCGFCSQSARYADGTQVGEAPIKSVDELVEGARRAAAAGAWRYCMVTATRGPSQRDLEVVCEAARRIKSELSLSLCASLGFLTEDKARRLAAAGIDRFNHNLETSERNFSQVVNSHDYRDRVATVRIAKQAGMEACCGCIVGMGEGPDDLLDLAYALRELDVDSLPVNFLDPRPGTPLADRERVEPGYALRVLCMFRLVVPRADLRVAGGREVTLRSMQALALYPANSLFTSGYLTTPGAEVADDHQMIRDMGFELEVHGPGPVTRRPAPLPTVRSRM